MSRQATESIVKAYLDAANRDDSAAILAMMHEDVAFDVNQSMRQIGLDNLRLLLATKSAHCKEQLADAVIFSSEDGSRGAAEFTWKGTYIATIEGFPQANGQRFSMQAGLFFEVEDGKITRITSHRDMREWVRQISEE
jgi:steroid delta-isomerase-like uncharacterized protein